MQISIFPPRKIIGFRQNQKSFNLITLYVRIYVGLFSSIACSISIVSSFYGQTNQHIPIDSQSKELYVINELYIFILLKKEVN